MTRTVTLVSVVGMFGAAVLVLVTSVDVLGRYLFDAPLPGAFELAQMFLALVVGLGIALATANDAHINVDALYVRMPYGARQVLRAADCVIGLMVFGAMAWKGTESSLQSLKLGEATVLLGMPVSPFKWALAASFLLCMLFLIHRLVRVVRGPSDL